MPWEVERLVKRCLRKDREHRFQVMADLRVTLEELKQESDSGELASAPTVAALYERRPPTAVIDRRYRRRWAALGIAAFIVAAVAMVLGLNVAGLRDRLLGRAAVPRIQSLARCASDTNFDRICLYLNRLPTEFRVLCVRDATLRQPAIRCTAGYTKWAVDHHNSIA